MTTTYIEDLTLAGRNDLFTLLSDALDAKGWTRTVLNSGTGAPAASTLAVREEIFQSPGNSVDVGRFFVGMRVFRSAAAADAIMVYAFTAQGPGGFVGVTSSSRTGTLVTVTTDTPHGMATGDIIIINGSTEPVLNECNSGTSTIHTTITVTGASTFTYVSDTSGTDSGTGGTCCAVFNLTGAISPGATDSFRINVGDAANDFVGAVDELGICGQVRQAGNERFFYLGSTGRGHIPKTMGQTLSATGAIVGSGGVQTVAVDQTVSDLFVGQPIDIIDVESARIFRTTVASFTAGSVDMDIDVSEDFAAGAIIGWDPMPVCTSARENATLTTIALNTYVWRVAYAINATRTWAQTDPVDALGTYNFTEPRVSTGEEGVQDDADVNLGALAAYDIVLVRSTAGPLTGTRGPLKNMVGVILANQVDFDYLKVGKNTPADDFKCFTSQQVTGALDHVAYGPNAPGAPAL